MPFERHCARVFTGMRTCGQPSASSDIPPECGETCADPAHQLPAGSRFHDLRHFYASALIAANLNPKIIQARLGHATLAETMDTYGHLFADAEDLAVLPSTKHSSPYWRNRGGTAPSTELPVSKNLQVSHKAAGELACRPGSVHPLARADGHPSRAAVADSLMRSTREHRAGHPQSLAQEPRQRRSSLLTLLRVGFAEPLGSLRALVVSYTTVSPLPPDGSEGGLFSVALSRGSPRVGVTDHPAQRSPDLPRRARLT